jgi:flavorubredoxin
MDLVNSGRRRLAMKARNIREGVSWFGVVDWDRRLFDSLIPLPDGTSYNAYLVDGGDKTVLVDTVDPTMADVLMSHLEEVGRIDFVISHHAEQDHSGAIPHVLQKYKEAKVLASSQGRGMLMDHLKVPGDRIIAVKDGEVLALGAKTLEFIYTPWVHWPETMVTHLREDKILFTCDFFGSHIAGTDLYVRDEGRVYEAAKRYYAEIMMPFRKVIQKNLEKVGKYDVQTIAPSHGPLYDKPDFIVQAYRDWVSDQPRNIVVIPYVSMHGSTERMVRLLVSSLAERGIEAHKFNLAVTDIGKLAISLVDAATIVLGTPTVHVGAHPAVAYAAYLANILRPKARFASVIGSFAWNSKAIEQIGGLIPNLKVEILGPVLAQGLPEEEHFKALDDLAEAILKKHQSLGLT